jgi:uncharacterized membrane protein YjjP (DUF1212 family)
MNREKEILDLAAQAGNILLENGAEIFRVEETMKRISQYYGVKNSNFFVMSSGIFLTAEDNERQIYAKVKHIPINAVHLDRIAAVNQLSREIAQGQHTVEEAGLHLEAIASIKGKKDLTRILFSGLGAGCFCYLSGGTGWDGMAAFAAGLLLYCFIIWTEKREKEISRIVIHITGGFLATFFSASFFLSGVGTNLSYIVIGSIMPLLPGVSFTNAIRDLANRDYIAGAIRMIDALLVSFGIALGMALMYILYHKVTGGMLI